MQCSQVYSIPIVYQDLRQPFVLKDIIQQLDQLDTLVNDIVNRLQFKIENQHQRLRDIDTRITNCQAKVKAITTTKPISVFSTAKYPGPQILPNLNTLYHDKPYAENPPLGPEPEEDVHYLAAESMTNAQKSQETADLLDLYTRINPFKELKKVQVNMAEDGLGALPDYVPSIGSVLLFNSSENPYQHYTSWDNLLGTDYAEEEEVQKELAKAPKTLIDGDELPSVQGLNYEFHPSMGEHSDLSTRLPANLPLENIADYQYAADTTTSTSIAPSLFHDKILPELPQITDFAEGPAKFEPASATDQLKIGAEWGDVPPPPPPPSNLEETSPPAMAFETSSMDPSLPPPPPPSVAADQIPVPEEVQEISSQPPLPPDIVVEEEEEESNPRAGLLDAIRNAGNLSTLRKVKEREVQVEREEAKAAPNKPLSIAEEMRQRMSRRQAAISGKQDQMEQKRDRQLLKKTEVLSAEVIKPDLPVLDNMSDTDPQESDKQSSYGDETDMLAQLRAIQQKQTLNPTPRASTTTRANAPPGADFEANMPGLDMYQRARSDSLDLSEASDWSDDD